MSNRRHLTPPSDVLHHAARAAEEEPLSAGPGAPQARPHQASARETAHEQAMADRARSSRSATMVNQSDSMRLKKGNSGRHH
ncbi:hypothetical protein GCM10009682_02880 [Luedemannella flava]|uniref:Uncharacterized protein n=1 Tax=Luedemannella flava TaxID=349316 RepID=A0ABN2LCR5_9ACTN